MSIWRPADGAELTRQNHAVGVGCLVLQHVVWWPMWIALLCAGWSTWYGVAALIVSGVAGLAALLIAHAAYGRIYRRHLDRIYGGAAQ